MTRSTTFPLLLVAAALLLAPSCDDASDLLGPEPPSGALRFTDIDAGYLHACAVTRTRAAYCWGQNMVGQLGDGTQQVRSQPVRVAGGHDFVQIDVGAAHGCAVDDEHRGWCWGHNDEGQLGDGSFDNAYEPIAVMPGVELASISAGHAHTCAVVRDVGSVWCWGDDSSGQLGDGGPNGTQRSNVPVRVAFDGAFTEVRAGFYQTCALTADGSAWCWGSNSAGQNGDGTDSMRHAPVAVQGGLHFRSLATGELFVCGVTDADDVYCWGANRWGELGESPETERHSPFPVDLSAESVTASSGPHTLGGARAFACAIRTDSRVACWGGSVPGIRTESPLPTLLDDDIEFGEIVAGPQFVCGLRVDGYAYCAGAGGSGQLGTGNTEDAERMSPVVRP